VQEGENVVVEKMEIRPVEAIPGTRGGRIKENDGGGEFKCDIS
jgi:hypothetical protein